MAFGCLGAFAVGAFLVISVVVRFQTAWDNVKHARVVDAQGHAIERGRREPAFDDAERNIFAYTGEQTAFGNTEPAQAYAASVSKKLELVRTLAFTKGRDPDAPSLSGNHFLTHCEMRQGKICFLVHVPELKGYTTDARQALARLAWGIVHQTLKSRPDAATLRVGVGLRGALLYGIVMTGSGSDKAPPYGDDPAVLQDFFTGPLPAPEATATPSPRPAPTATLTTAQRVEQDVKDIQDGTSNNYARRTAAERDLAELGAPATGRLMEIAEDKASSSVQRRAAFHALGVQGTPETLAFLVRALNHDMGDALKDVKDRERLVRLMTQAIARECTHEVPLGPRNEYCRAAVNELGFLGPSAAPAVPVLLRVIGSNPRTDVYDLHSLALWAAGRIGPKASACVRYIVPVLKDKYESTRELAVEALQGIGPGAMAAVPALEEARQDGSVPAAKVEAALTAIRGEKGAARR